MRALKQHAPNLATILVAAFCAVWYCNSDFLRPSAGLRGPSDFHEFHRAAQAILNGRSPYENPAWFYPPLTAFLLAPFALTDYFTARWIWFILSHVFLLSAAWIFWRGIGYGRIALCSIAIVWTFGGPARESFVNGQIGAALVLLLVLAFIQRSTRQGLAIGAGSALKYIPGILALALILNRSWRALAAFAVTIVIGIFIPWLVLLSFPGAKAPTRAHYWMGTPATFSWSIPSVVLRILEPPQPGGRLPYNWEFGNVAADLQLTRSHELISAATAVFVLAAGIAALLLACHGRLDSAQMPWAMAGLISLSLAAAPVCWTHYQILQYPGVAWMLARTIERRAWMQAAFLLACGVMLYQLPQAMLTTYYNAHAGWTAASLPTLYIWTSVTPVACLGIFGLTLWKLIPLAPS